MPGPAPKRAKNPKTQAQLLTEQSELLVQQGKLLEEIRDEFREDRLSSAAIVAWWKDLSPTTKKFIIWVGLPVSDIVIGSFHPEWAGIIRSVLLALMAGGDPFPIPPMGP